MSDSKHWNRRGPPPRFDLLTMPVGERVSHVFAGMGDVAEIPLASGYLVVEVENGPFRCRVGLLDARTYTIDLARSRVVMAGHPYRDGDGPLRTSTTGTLPAGFDPDTDYWIREVEPGATFRASLTPDGPILVNGDAGTGVHSMGGDNGAGQPVGFAPTSPPVADVDGHGAKLLRTDEVQVFDGPITVQSTMPNGILTYWTVS